jgi:hypothetical protein
MLEAIDVNIFPNPAQDLVAIQIKGLNKEDLSVGLRRCLCGKLVKQKTVSRLYHFLF